MTMRLNASGKRKLIDVIQSFLDAENEQQREFLINRFEFHPDDLLDIVSESLSEAKAHSTQYEQFSTIYDALGLKDWAKTMRYSKQTLDDRIQRAEQKEVWVSLKETSLENYPYKNKKEGKE